nr:uncharacterized protein LOC109757950 isoform X2 [Aegilops tauschii subsp. strangulata]
MAFPYHTGCGAALEQRSGGFAAAPSSSCCHHPHESTHGEGAAAMEYSRSGSCPTGPRPGHGRGSNCCTLGLVLVMCDEEKRFEILGAKEEDDDGDSDSKQG